MVQTWIHKHNEKAAKARSELTKKYDLKLQKSVVLSTSMRNFEDAYAIPVEPIPCKSTWGISSYVSEPKLMSPGSKRMVGGPFMFCFDCDIVSRFFSNIY
ncbi:hypothetical protein RDI58_024442 [Solanum bulbocastanum]|uniref:Uncharacterized protein n=1 Tax=Solanum bulbocastanum TaxID=147425 RepID=A0AAN8T1A7_SOLBU